MVLQSIKRSRTLESLQIPGFRLFYVNSTFAAVDMNVRMAVHGWLVLQLSGDSEFWVGIYALLLGLGQFLFSMVAGAIVDRFQPRNLLLIEGTLGASLAGSLALATFFDATTLGMALTLAFVMGCLRAIRFTATNRFVYDLVGPRRLVNGVSLWRVSTAPMMIFGAMLAGALIEWPGIWAAYAFMAISLTLALPFLLLIDVRGNAGPSGTSLIQEIAEGIRYAAGNQPLRTLFTVSIVMESLGFAFLVMIPVVAKTVLDVGGAGMGVLQGGVGAGTLVATLVMARIGDSRNKPRIVFFNALGAGLALIAFALSRSLLLSTLLGGALMAFLNAYDLTLGALLQLVAPPHLRGRAVSLHSLAISFTGLGGFVMGAVGSIVGVPIVLAAAGTGILANSILRRSSLMKIRESSARE